MPVKSTKTTTKSDSKTSKNSEKKSSSKTVAKKTEKKESSSKKVVVKRRKTDLAPTKASAVAIASQANRAKKKALIEKMATTTNIPRRKTESSSDTKIPLRVRIFFWCSLLLFCISFYKAIIHPQLENDEIIIDDTMYVVDEDLEEEQDIQETENYDENENIIENQNLNQTEWEWEQEINVPTTATETIEEFFNRLSNRNFDGASDLMMPALRNYQEIKDHFTEYRMNPFLDWIQWWKLNPTNFEYVNSPGYWRDVYKFDLSYVMNSDQSKYDEIREFTVNTQWDEPKIASIRCVTSRCSYHPIFWPENFGLMR